MSKRKLNLSFNDIRESFGNLNQSHPFEFFLSFDHEVFKFKSRTSANKFLNNFEINYNHFYFEIFDSISFLYLLNISSIHLKTNQDLHHHRTDLDFYVNRTEDFLKYRTPVNLPAREILNFFYLIEDQMFYFLKLYQKSNRNQYLLKSIKNSILSLKRLKVDLDSLLENTSSLSIVPKEALQTKKYRIMKIA